MQGNSLETITKYGGIKFRNYCVAMFSYSERYHNPLIKVIPFTVPAPARRIAIAWRKSFVRLESIEKIAEAVKAINSDYMKSVILIKIQKIKKAHGAPFLLPLVLLVWNYLFITYIVTSKPKRISVAAGFVHMVDLLISKLIKTTQSMCCILQIS